jgi:hypothetical protein
MFRYSVQVKKDLFQACEDSTIYQGQGWSIYSCYILQMKRINFNTQRTLFQIKTELSNKKADLENEVGRQRKGETYTTHVWHCSFRIFNNFFRRSSAVSSVFVVAKNWIV